MSAKNDYAGLCLFFFLLLAACSDQAGDGREVPAEPLSTVIAETVYFGGDIVTMNDDQPAVGAVAVRDGKIIAVGDLQSLESHSDSDTRRIDLKGKTLLPGFFDSHSHLVMTAAKMSVVELDPPPVGPAESIASIQAALRQRLAAQPPAKGEWLIGWGYDHVMLEEGRHPTRQDLDQVSRDVPVMVIHYSGHQVSVNSKGLALSGIDESTEDPAGGRIFRESDGRHPNGILQEMAMYSVVFPILNRLMTGSADISAGQSPSDEALQRLDDALTRYTAQGFTTVTEMGATQQAVAVLQAMADQERLPVDVIAIAISKAWSSDQIAGLRSGQYNNHFRVGGTKIVLDGGSPGRSAWLLKPYYEQLPGEENYRGFPHIPDQDVLNRLVVENIEAENPLYIHALGDAAVGQAITALQSAGTSTRTQLIHVQQVTEDQLDLLESLGVTLTFQVAHNYYFGDFHRQHIYGPERTARLNPAQSALNRGISVSIHHDSPVHPVDQMMLIWSAVNRVTRSGQVIGDEQRISVIDALKASTINAAYQFFEEDRKGSIEVGKLADLVVLSDNPLKVDPLLIKDIRILETIKEGKTVFSAY